VDPNPSPRLHSARTVKPTRSCRELLRSCRVMHNRKWCISLCGIDFLLFVPKADLENWSRRRDFRWLSRVTGALLRTPCSNDVFPSLIITVMRRAFTHSGNQYGKRVLQNGSHIYRRDRTNENVTATGFLHGYRVGPDNFPVGELNSSFCLPQAGAKYVTQFPVKVKKEARITTSSFSLPQVRLTNRLTSSIENGGSADE